MPDRAGDITLPAMILETLPAVQQLSAGDKLRLWEELWEQVAADESRWPVREDHLALLNERMAHYRAHPETLSLIHISEPTRPY